VRTLIRRNRVLQRELLTEREKMELLQVKLEENQFDFGEMEESARHA